MALPPTDLEAELREAVTSGRGNYGHRLLCGRAAEQIKWYQNYILAADNETTRANTKRLQAEHERDCAVEALTELRKYSIAACSEMGCFCGDEEGEVKCVMCVLEQVIRAFDVTVAKE